MMSDLLASDNINLHNRVGKRDHAHTTLAPPHHESQRTRDQRKGPPLPKATSHPDRRKAQRAGRGPATSKPAREPHTVTTAPTNNQQFTARGGRGVQCTKSWRRETADSPAWPPRGPTVRAEPTCTCSVPACEIIATPHKGRPATGGAPAGRARGVVSMRGNASRVIHALISARRPRGQALSTAINMQNRCAGAQHTVPGRGARTREGAGWEASSAVSEANCAALSAMPIDKQSSQKAVSPPPAKSLCLK